MAIKETYSIDAAQAERAMASLAKAGDKIAKGAEESTKQLTKAEKAARRLNEQADPTRRHARQMEELAKHVKTGAVNMGNAERLASRYQRQLERAGTSGKRAFGPEFLTRVSALATPILSVSGALAAVNKELAAQQALADKRVLSQLSVSQSRSVVRRNAISLSDAGIADLQRKVDALADATGVSEVPINIGLASTLSAAGGNAKVAFAATRIGTRYLADAPSDIGTVAGTLVDLAKVTGTNNPRANLGYLAAVGSAGRVVDPKQQAANIAPGIINALPYGGTGQGLGALTAALTFAGADTTGARTGTALPNLARQLQEYDLKDTSFAGATTAERLRALQSLPKARGKFLGGLSLDSKVRGLVIDLLSDPTSNAARAFDANVGLIPESPSALAGLGDEAIRKLDVANDLAPVAARGRYLDRTLEGLQTGRPSRQLSSTEITQFESILQETGSYALGTDAGTFLKRLDGDGVTTREVRDSLRARESSLRYGKTVGFGGPYGGGGSVQVPATETELEAAGKIDALAGKFDTLIEIMETNASSNERTATATERSSNPSEE